MGRKKILTYGVAAVFFICFGALLFGSDERAAPSETSLSEVSDGSQDQESANVDTDDAESEASQARASSDPRSQSPVVGSMRAYFFDVGQADASLLVGPDFAVLIDAGDYRRSDVVPHLRNAGVEALDLLIGTHPHADHIGQFPQVISAFDVKEVWMSGDEHTTQTFERALDAILASDAQYHEPRAGEVRNIGSLKIEVLNPSRLTGDLHEGSVSIRAVYGDVSLVFTGDAEAQTESQIIARGHELNSQILQLGHHGSRTSTALAFLRAVQPEVAVYSAGDGNQYGHPHSEVVNRVRAEGIELYGTDTHGTVVIETDGSTYSVDTARSGAPRAPPPATTEPSTPEATQDDAIEPAPTTQSSCGPGQVDINSAPLEDLQLIQHIGPARAEDLISLRPFSSVDSMTRISGISANRLNDIKNQGIACVN
jgi:competence protein ComEC